MSRQVGRHSAAQHNREKRMAIVGLKGFWKLQPAAGNIGKADKRRGCDIGLVGEDELRRRVLERKSWSSIYASESIRHLLTILALFELCGLMHAA
jgi:hypothetical protein